MVDEPEQPRPADQDTLAPLIKETRIEYSVARFNGTFMHEDIYRQTGSAEVDAAWEALGVDCKRARCVPTVTSLSYSSLLTTTLLADRAGVISVEEGLRSGLTSAHVQRSMKYGGGYFVNVEGLHHLHCLVSSNFCSS